MTFRELDFDLEMWEQYVDFFPLTVLLDFLNCFIEGMSKLVFSILGVAFVTLPVKESECIYMTLN